jgi:SRSO17 transposase
MTDEGIRQLGPAFAAYLRRYRPCFLQDRTADHFGDYSRALLSDLERKSVEPIALASGTAVRTLQAFLAVACWDHDAVRDTLQRHVASLLPDLPGDRLGTVGVIDETSCRKSGTHTPGVQRQYLGCVGKVDNGIVTVHVGLAKGRFQALLDGELYLPKSWDRDRDRCKRAGIPADVRYLAKWRIALDQVIRLHGNGITFDWLVFDEGYGSKVPLLRGLCLVNQRFVGEVPVSFSVRTEEGGPARRADAVLTAQDAAGGVRWRQRRESVADAWWRASEVEVVVGGRRLRLVVAINEATAELKYFVTNAPSEPLSRVLAVAFRRATIEHGFRLAKQEAGLMHYEGRQYTGLRRHLILALVVMGFVSIHADRLRGEKPGGDQGAGVPGLEPALRGAVAPATRHDGGGARRRSDPLPPASQCRGSRLTPQAAA